MCRHLRAQARACSPGARVGARPRRCTHLRGHARARALARAHRHSRAHARMLARARMHTNVRARAHTCAYTRACASVYTRTCGRALARAQTCGVCAPVHPGARAQTCGHACARDHSLLQRPTSLTTARSSASFAVPVAHAQAASLPYVTAEKHGLEGGCGRAASWMWITYPRYGRLGVIYIHCHGQLNHAAPPLPRGEGFRRAAKAPGQQSPPEATEASTK